jgi:urease beta subunit
VKVLEIIMKEHSKISAEKDKIVMNNGRSTSTITVANMKKKSSSLVRR